MMFSSAFELFDRCDLMRSPRFAPSLSRGVAARLAAILDPASNRKILANHDREGAFQRSKRNEKLTTIDVAPAPILLSCHAKV